MAESNVIFKLGKGGLGRPLQGFDHYSAMIGYYNETSATSAYATIGNKQYSSIQDAEADGVVNTYIENTASSVTDTTTAGTVGDTIVANFTSYNGSVIALGTAIASTSPLLTATSIVTAINANTYITGFSAVVGAAGAYTVTAPKKLGIFPNGKSITYVITGTTVVTPTTFAGGTRSWLAIFHYQISEFFRANPLGILFFSIKFDVTSQNITAFNTQLISDIATVSNLWAGNARRYTIGATGRTFATSMLDALKTASDSLYNLYVPAILSICADNTATALSAQPNLRALNDAGCSFIGAQSGSGEGYMLSKTQMQVIGSHGACLGTSSSAAVSQSIAEVGQFNISNGTECETAVFLDGTDYNTIAQGLRNQLNDYGYIYLRKFANKTGTFFNSGNCAVSPSSDYAYMRDNITIYKAIRNVYKSILDLLNARNYLNANGTLAETSIQAYKALAGYPLTQMFKDGDLSIDPASTSTGIVVSRTEVVASTSNIPITITLTPRGIGRSITITIGYGLTS